MHISIKNFPFIYSDQLAEVVSDTILRKCQEEFRVSLRFLALTIILSVLKVINFTFQGAFLLVEIDDVTMDSLNYPRGLAISTLSDQALIFALLSEQVDSTTQPTICSTRSPSSAV